MLFRLPFCTVRDKIVKVSCCYRGKFHGLLRTKNTVTLAVEGISAVSCLMCREATCTCGRQKDTCTCGCQEDTCAFGSQKDTCVCRHRGNCLRVIKTGKYLREAERLCIMKITAVRLAKIHVPLRVPFKTALRRVDSIEDVIVEIDTDTGEKGFGEAPPTGVITGDTTGAIVGAIKDHIGPKLIGRDVDDFEDVLKEVQKAIVHNTSAKAAVDIALYDLYGQLYKIPVYKLLGGARKSIVTDITISVNDPDEMARDAVTAVKRGYDTLKVKVGVNPDLDVERLEAVRRAAGPDVRIRIDANQAWTPKQAVRILNRMEERGLGIELVEQPVKAADFDGLREVTAQSPIPVLADEAVFSPEDAMKIMQYHAADMVNIKLMKCGGLYNALKIVSMAEVCGMECMLGCMLEAKVSVNAAVELACAKKIITRIDLDGPVLCSEDPILGGAVFDEKNITVSDEPGMGIRGFEEGRLAYFDEVR